MLHNLTAVYGLRAMAVLAKLAAGESVNAAELSERTGVPQQYLSKVMRKLVLAKLVSGRRGRGGGFTLAKPARQVRLADVLEALDMDLDGGCAFGFAKCDPKNPCALHPIWSRLQDDLSKWTHGSTFADLGPDPEKRSRQTG